jgi:hypothetical protein
VISIPSGLTGAAYERAATAAPPFAESDEIYPDMIARAGWEIDAHIDLTGAYLDSARVTVVAEEQHGEALKEVQGEAEYAARLARRKLLVEILQEGLARRELFVAVNPAAMIEPGREARAIIRATPISRFRLAVARRRSSYCCAISTGWMRRRARSVPGSLASAAKLLRGGQNITPIGSFT